MDLDKLEAVTKRMKSVREEASSPGGVNIGKLNAAKQAYDDATDYPEILALIAEVRVLREERAGLLGGCRVAVMALAHACEYSPMYRKAYDHVSAAIDAARFTE